MSINGIENSETNPRDVKMRLAREITTLYCGVAEATMAYCESFFVIESKQDSLTFPSLSVSCLLYILRKIILYIDLLFFSNKPLLVSFPYYQF